MPKVTVWPQDIFRPGLTTIESLQSALLMFDFAVFVMSPDDRLTSRGRAGQTPRDNVIFELGLFIGRLGRNRVFFIVPRNMPKLHVPSDLLGVTVLSFDPVRSDGNIRAALGPACNQMRQIFVGSARHSPQEPLASVSIREEHEPTRAQRPRLNERRAVFVSQGRTSRLSFSQILMVSAQLTSGLELRSAIRSFQLLRSSSPNLCGTTSGQGSEATNSLPV